MHEYMYVLICVLYWAKMRQTVITKYISLSWTPTVCYNPNNLCTLGFNFYVSTIYVSNVYILQSRCICVPMLHFTNPLYSMCVISDIL